METSAFPDFATAAQGVLRHLHARLGYGLWMVTRTTGDDQVAVHAVDEDFGVQDGTVFTWSDSFCRRMVEGEAPRVAPDTDLVPAYRDAPAGARMGIRSYVGVPLRYADDSLFGTLCAIDHAPREPLTDGELATIELFASLLSSLLEHERRADEHAQRAEHAERRALIDELTSLPNRRAWTSRSVARRRAACATDRPPPCWWPTSTGSRRSTIATGTAPATSCSSVPRSR